MHSLQAGGLTAIFNDRSLREGRNKAEVKESSKGTIRERNYLTKTTTDGTHKLDRNGYEDRKGEKRIKKLGKTQEGIVVERKREKKKGRTPHRTP